MSTPQRILVFRIGQLGDTVVALPAMWAIRRHFRQARLTLLSDCHPRLGWVVPSDLLAGAGLFDEFLSYPVDASGVGGTLRWWRMLRLLTTMRRKAFDLLVYLAPSARTSAQIARDRRFFAAAGIGQFLGMRSFPQFPSKAVGQPLPIVPSEADLLLARLAADGVPVPSSGAGSFDLNLGKAEEQQVESWLRGLPSDGGRPWIAVGPGSKIPAKRWPLERFAEVGASLVAERDVWPVIFGGPEDRPAGDMLLREWGRGYNAAGVLALRSSAAALKRCRLYLGNDTGTMHLAAAVGVPCAAVFSARDFPGRWYPNGRGHHVFRSQVDCEGCGLTACVERHNECLERISAAEVLAACQSILHASRKLPLMAM